VRDEGGGKNGTERSEKRTRWIFWWIGEEEEDLRKGGEFIWKRGGEDLKESYIVHRRRRDFCDFNTHCLTCV